MNFESHIYQYTCTIMSSIFELVIQNWTINFAITVNLEKEMNCCDQIFNKFDLCYTEQHILPNKLKSATLVETQ